DDDHPLGAETAGLRALALDGPARIVGLRTDPGRAQLGDLGEHRGAVRAVLADEEDVHAFLALRFDAGLLEREQEPLDARAEADAGRVRPAERLRKAVVAAAPAQGALRAAL